MNSDLTEDQIDKIVNALEGTCDTVETVLEKMELEADVNGVEAAVAEMGLARCPVCEWWMEMCEIADDDGNFVGCDSCR